MLSGHLFGPGGNTTPEDIGSMGGEYGPLRRRHSGKGRAVPGRCPSIPSRSSFRCATHLRGGVFCGCSCPCWTTSRTSGSSRFDTCSRDCFDDIGVSIATSRADTAVIAEARASKKCQGARIESEQIGWTKTTRLEQQKRNGWKGHHALQSNAALVRHTDGAPPAHGRRARAGLPHQPEPAGVLLLGRPTG